MPRDEDATTMTTYDAQRRWLQRMHMASEMTSSFGYLEGYVWIRHDSLLYRRTLLTLTATELQFDIGLVVDRTHLHEISADLRKLSVRLDYSTPQLGVQAQQTVRVRCQSYEAMKMWLRALPPTRYKNEEYSRALAPPDKIGAPKQPPTHHQLQLAADEAAAAEAEDEAAAAATPAVAALELVVQPGGRVGASLRVVSLGARNLDTGETLSVGALQRAYSDAPHDAFSFCRRANKDTPLDADAPGTLAAAGSHTRPARAAAPMRRAFHRPPRHRRPPLHHRPPLLTRESRTAGAQPRHGRERERGRAAAPVRPRTALRLRVGRQDARGRRRRRERRSRGGARRVASEQQGLGGARSSAAHVAAAMSGRREDGIRAL